MQQGTLGDDGHWGWEGQRVHAGVHGGEDEVCVQHGGRGQLNSLEKVIIIILSRNKITKYIISMDHISFSPTSINHSCV